MEKKMKLFLAEGFIQELNTDKKVVYNDKLTDEKLSLIRGLCVVKYMARQGVNMSLKEADKYWRVLWAGVWDCPPSPSKSVSVFFTNQHR